ncbi:hypothetical protein Q5530_02575 [Saccharothrix sp. BKS2]|uniref:hypothetical protein n=1 Tax=Saccharothrix sp. BKS2 TaxID=3064400 RepID=UPI0039E82A26
MSLQRSLLVCCDLRSYGSADDRLQRELQELLVRSLDRAGEVAGLDRSTWARQPKGDEEWAVLPVGTPDHLVVDRYVRALDAELASVNAYRVPHAHLRMRMAVHFGTTAEGANGYPGQDAVLVSRLMDSAAARAALEQTDAHLAVVLSEVVYASVVAAGYTTLRPGDFREVEVRVKDFVGRGRLWIPGGDAHALRLEDAAAAGSGSAGVAGSAGPGPSSVTQHATASGGSTVVQAGRDAHVPTQHAEVIQNFERNDQRGSSFGPVVRGREKGQ